MSIEWRKSGDGRKVMYVTGPFDFSRHKEFMERIRQYQRDPQSRFFDVDLSGVTRLDTAGLGMLLLLLDRLGGRDREVALVNCSRQARDSLRFAGLERRFRIV